jgi:hypothetical protein
MRRLWLGLIGLLALGACASPAQRLDAADDVHALLIAIRDGDQAAFDAHVDRQALKQQLQAELGARLGRDKRLGDLASLLGPSVVDLAGDALLQPQTFKLVAEQYGYTPRTKIPGVVTLAAALKPLPDGRVCATRAKDGPCVLVFTKEDGAWKLTSFEGDVSMLRLKL